MKLTFLLPAMAASLALTGCDTPALISLEPLVTDQQSIFDATLLGVWGSSDSKELAIFRRDGDTAYSVTYASDGNTRQFTANLFRAGDAQFLDLAPECDDGFLIPGHAVVRIWADGAKFRWAFVDSPWFAEQAGMRLANRKLGEKQILLTAPAEAIRGVLANYGGDDKAHEKITEWQRVQ